MTNLHRQENEKFIEGKVNISNPFRASELPPIVQLYRMAFHKYKRRGTKRLFKRPARLLFDFAYHVLRLKGKGTLTFKTRWGTQNLRFNGRNSQFGGVYTFPDNHIFEAPLIGLMWTLIKGDDVFFDIDANWGCISLHAATFSEF